MEHKQDHSADADHRWAEGIFGHLAAKEEDISSTHACVLPALLPATADAARLSSNTLEEDSKNAFD